MAAPSPIVKYLDQDYQTLKAEYLKCGKLFEDPTFPADDSSLYYNHSISHGLQWYRPKEMIDNPKVYLDGADRLDMRQGTLGDCWFVASLASLATEPSLMYRVLPNDQTFDHDYAGIFHVRFWRMGQWVDVVIDDRLPCNQHSKWPTYVHPSDKHEFWGCLIEKAYAKLNHSYEALVGGHSWEAMGSFTGGIHEEYSLKHMPPDGFERISRALQHQSLLGCFGVHHEQGNKKHMLANGLVWGHSYSIDKAVKVSLKGETNQASLIRIRNPWGHGEWNGAWSDGSSEWDGVSEETKKAIGFTKANNGEFWMSYDDLCSSYGTVEICMLKPDVDLKDGARKQWNVQEARGEWKKGVNAGGCWNYLNSYYTNPQIRFEIPDSNTPGGSSVLISLMQTFKRPFHGTQENSENHLVSFTIYKVSGDQIGKILDRDYITRHPYIARCNRWGKASEVSYRFVLTSGHYVVMPVTYRPNEEAEFLLRIFTEKPVEVSQEYWLYWH